MKKFQYYKRSSGEDLLAWRQVMRAMSEYWSSAAHIALFVLWVLFGIGFLAIAISIIITKGLAGARSGFSEVPLFFSLWLGSFAFTVGVMMHPQFVMARQLGIPGAIRTLFRVNLGITLLVGLPIWGVLYLCVGNASLVTLCVYVFAMAYLPASLGRIHHVLVIMLFGGYVFFMLPAFLPGLPKVFELSFATPQLIGLLFAAVAYWVVAWRRVFRNWSLDEEAIEDARRKFAKHLGESKDYDHNPREWWGWIHSPLEFLHYRRLLRLSAKRFWGRIRLGLLAYSDPKGWLVDVLWVMFVLFFLYRGVLRDHGDSLKLGRGDIAFYFSIAIVAALTSLTGYMSRWRDTIALHRFYPMTNRVAIREAAVQFAIMLFKKWFFFFAFVFTFIYWMYPVPELLWSILSFMAFSAAFLCFQYGCSILLMLTLEEGIVANQGAACILSWALFAFLWYFIGWPVTVSVLLLGLVISFGAYRRLHTIELDLLANAKEVC